MLKTDISRRDTSDEAFVAGVVRRIARRRLVHRSLWAGTALLIVTLAITISPWVVIGADYVAAAPLFLNDYLVATLQSPFTEIGALVFAVMKVVRG